MVDEQDLPILDSRTKRTSDDLWVLADEAKRSVPVDLEFAPWDEDSTTDHHEKYTTGYYGSTDGSRRVSAAFGWSLRSYNKQGKLGELEHNQGALKNLKPRLMQRWSQSRSLWTWLMQIRSLVI
jgi:hypothetical protein